MMKSGLWSVLALIGACAAGPPAEDGGDWRYRRDTAGIEAQEEFEALKETCSRSRGAVIVNRTFSRRMRRTPDDVRLATCQPGAAGAVY